MNYTTPCIENRTVDGKKNKQKHIIREKSFRLKILGLKNIKEIFAANKMWHIYKIAENVTFYRIADNLAETRQYLQGGVGFDRLQGAKNTLYLQ